MRRLFVGLSVPDALRFEVKLMSGGIPQCRWIDPEDLHITLRFVGEVDELTGNELEAALQEISFRPFSLQPKGIGVFPPRGVPKIIWIGLKSSKELLELQKRIDAKVTHLGHDPEERKFHDHMTIARMSVPPERDVAQYVRSHSLFTADPWIVDAFHIYESHLSKNGAHYEVVSTIKARDVSDSESVS